MIDGKRLLYYFREMGTTKDSITPKSEKSKSLFSSVRKKFGSAAKKLSDIESFAEAVTEAETSLRLMIAQKQSDLKTEKGKEDENMEKLILLRTMASQLDMLIYTADQYGTEQ